MRLSLIGHKLKTSSFIRDVYICIEKIQERERRSLIMTIAACGKRGVYYRLLTRIQKVVTD